MVVHEDIVVRDFTKADLKVQEPVEKYQGYSDIKSTTTTIPFVKDNEFDYEWLLPSFLDPYTDILFVLVVIFVVAAVSNG